jgi:NADPH:quinone reductase
MRAALCTSYDGIDAVELVDLPDPVPGPGEVRIAVRAASINFPDLLMIEDRYQVTLPLPFVPGSELAGVVEDLGADVDHLAPGDRVFGAAPMGAFAEQVVLPAAAVQPIPDGVDFAAASALGVAHGTAYHSLRSVAEVAPGEWVAVLGAAGGVGLAAVELAHQLGARVLAAAAGEERLAVCAGKGADALVDYRAEDLKTRMKELTGGGADVVIDPVGGPYAEQALRAMRRGGRFVTVGFASGEIPKIPLNLVLLKAVTIKGFEMRTFMQDHAQEMQRDRAELMQLFAEGTVTPHISATYPLDKIHEALHAVAARTTTGKVVITND